MNAQEEPSYLAFARANVRDDLSSSSSVVRGLLARIDRDASALRAAAQPRIITTEAQLVALPAGTVIRDGSGRLWEWEHVGYGGVDKALSAMGIGSMLAATSFRSFPATVLPEATR